MPLTGSRRGEEARRHDEGQSALQPGGPAGHPGSARRRSAVTGRKKSPGRAVWGSPKAPQSTDEATAAKASREGGNCGPEAAVLNVGSSSTAGVVTVVGAAPTPSASIETTPCRSAAQQGEPDDAVAGDHDRSEDGVLRERAVSSPPQTISATSMTVTATASTSDATAWCTTASRAAGSGRRRTSGVVLPRFHRGRAHPAEQDAGPGGTQWRMPA